MTCDALQPEDCHTVHGCGIMTFCQGESESCAEFNQDAEQCGDASGCTFTGFCEGGWVPCQYRAANEECEEYGPGCELVEDGAE